MFSLLPHPSMRQPHPPAGWPKIHPRDPHMPDDNRRDGYLVNLVYTAIYAPIAQHPQAHQRVGAEEHEVVRCNPVDPAKPRARQLHRCQQNNLLCSSTFLRHTIAIATSAGNRIMSAKDTISNVSAPGW